MSGATSVLELKVVFMNLLTLSLVIALPGERTERQLGGEEINHERKIWKISYL